MAGALIWPEVPQAPAHQTLTDVCTCSGGSGCWWRFEAVGSRGRLGVQSVGTFVLQIAHKSFPSSPSSSLCQFCRPHLERVCLCSNETTGKCDPLMSRLACARSVWEENSRTMSALTSETREKKILPYCVKESSHVRPSAALSYAAAIFVLADCENTTPLPVYLFLVRNKH